MLKQDANKVQLGSCFVENAKIRYSYGTAGVFYCSKKWIGINETVYSKIKNKKNLPSSLIQDGKTFIAEHFSNFFIGIVQKLQKRSRLLKSIFPAS